MREKYKLRKFARHSGFSAPQPPPWEKLKIKQDNLNFYRLNNFTNWELPQNSGDWNFPILKS